MSDEQIIVRHVRLCGCGKPAGHISVCARDRTPAGLTPDDVERVSTAAEEVIAERGRLRYERRRRDFDTDRRQRFASMDTLALHRWVTEHAVSISTVKAGSVEPSRGGAADTIAPPRQQTLEDDPRWREHMSVIRSRLEQAAELVLEAQGLSTVAGTTGMLGVEKDALVLHPRNEGLRAQAVVDRLGSHVAGSAETVRRIRRREGYDTTGYKREEVRS